MTSSGMIWNNPVTNSSRSTISRSNNKKKTKKKIILPNQSQNVIDHQTQWKSEAQQQAYSSKLLQALRQVRQATPKRGGRAVREAADRVLAVTAKGRTRWSRAILTTNRLKLKFMKKTVNKRQKVLTVTGAGNRKILQRNKHRGVSILRLKKKMKNLPAVQRKAKVLGRLVPGCRKEPLPVILEEATDYIAALEMQVRAMSVLADLLSGASTSSSSSSSSSNGGGLNQLGSSRPADPPSS